MVMQQWSLHLNHEKENDTRKIMLILIVLIGWKILSSQSERSK